MHSFRGNQNFSKSSARTLICKFKFSITHHNKMGSSLDNNYHHFPFVFCWKFLKLSELRWQRQFRLWVRICADCFCDSLWYGLPHTCPSVVDFQTAWKHFKAFRCKLSFFLEINNIRLFVSMAIRWLSIFLHCCCVSFRTILHNGYSLW